MKTTTMMKAFALVVVCACTMAVQAEDKAISLSDARAKIESAVSNPSEVTSLMKQLAPTDQIKFLAEVNDAISQLPGSVEEKTALFLNANRAALRGAAKGNAADLLAEVFATVPPESLTAVNEVFASDVVSRTADPSKTYTDEQFLTIASNVLAKVAERVGDGNTADVRKGFAALMFIRAANGSPENVAELLADKVFDNADVVKLAKNEWFPAALGQGQDKTYEPMLAYCDAPSAPNMSNVIRVAGPQSLALMTSLLQSGVSDPAFASNGGFGDISKASIGDDSQLWRVPRTLDPHSKVNPGYRRGDTDPKDEPIPYSGTRTK